MPGRPKEYPFYVWLLITGIAFIAGFLLRWSGAQDLPINLTETQGLVQALKDTVPSGPAFPNQAWLGLTRPLFYLLPASELLGRLWPILFGTSLTLLPFVWRTRFTLLPYVAVSFLLAFDPILVRASIDISYPTIALAAMAWTTTAYLKKWHILLGVMAAVALLAGKFFWLALLLAGFSLITARLILARNSDEASKLNLAALTTPTTAISFGLSILAIGTSFFLKPSGLAGIGSGLAEIFNINLYSGALPQRILALARVAYAWPGLLMLGPALAHAFRTKKNLFLASGTLALLALILSFAMPSEPGFTLVFAMASLVCTVPWLTIKLKKLDVSPYGLGLGIFILVIAAYIVMQVHNLGWQNQYGNLTIPSLIGSLAGIALIVLAYALVRIGWGNADARTGVTLSVLVLVTILTAATTFSLVGPQAEARALLFSRDALVDPQGSIDTFLGGFERGSPIETADLNLADKSPYPGSTAWLFRNYKFSTGAQNPNMVLTTVGEQLPFPDAYNGTNLIIERIYLLNPDLPPLYSLRDMLLGRNGFLDERIKIWVQTNLTLGTLP